LALGFFHSHDKPMKLIGQFVRTPSNAQSAGEKDRLGGLSLVNWEIPEKPKDFQAVERS
jgi:hypothetical protein